MGEEKAPIGAKVTAQAVALHRHCSALRDATIQGETGATRFSKGC